MNYIDSKTIAAAVDSTKAHHPSSNPKEVLEHIAQVARFWSKDDGTSQEFIHFCSENWIDTDSARISVMEKLSRNFEIINGNFNRISLGLKEPLHMNLGEISPIDQMFGGYEASSHLTDDFFKNKIAFYILLNYKFYPLTEKDEMANGWNRKQWAMARLAQSFDSRIPAALLLKYSDINTQADTYISEYNIFMGKLVNNKGEKLFPADMKLISHWGLRDELKVNYTTDKGLEKQRMIFSVMNHIIQQDLPSEVINSDTYEWNPISNKLLDKGKEVPFHREADVRYDWLLKNFVALRDMDAYNPFFPTYIQTKFDREMEIPQPEVEKLFTDLVSSPQVKKVASLIEKRIGRKLEPFDLWYDGFKTRNTVDTKKLDEILKKKYPNSEAFQKDIPNILQKLGFTKEKADYIASKVQVDASRGAGHAWGAAMHGDKSRLRTRIEKEGMNYQGFNVAMHELGHCVEQTLTLYDMDEYLLNGVPNTAFTEALAFVFQKRDLFVLGMDEGQSASQGDMALDIFWSNYEIMGVSLVDMAVWKWLYEHPNATREQLKDAVIHAAKEVWNKYYASIFGTNDQAILAIYSHMIDYPLYLSAYPIGFLISFQIEKQLEGKNFATEVMRIFSKGRITPKQWMMDAVGSHLSNAPLLEAVDKAVGKGK